MVRRRRRRSTEPTQIAASGSAPERTRDVVAGDISNPVITSKSPGPIDIARDTFDDPIYGKEGFDDPILGKEGFEDPFFVEQQDD